MEHMKKGETRPSNWKGSLEAKWQCHIPSSHSHFLRFPLFSWCVCPLLECRMIMNDFWHTTRLKWYWGKTTELKIYWAPDCWHQSFESQLRPRPGVAQRLLQLCLAKIRVSSKKTHTQVFLGVPWNSHTFSSSHLSLWSVQSAAPTGNPVCTSLPIAVASNSSDLKATRAQEQTCREKNGPLTAEALTCSTKFGSRPGKESKVRYSFASY
jgi:hypothetical protein